MKNLNLLLFFTLSIYSVNAQIITFADPVFKAKLLAANATNFIARDLNGDYFSIDSNSNGEIEIAETLQVGFLEIANSSISSISEISNFINLITLNCENNQLSSLNTSGLTSLTILDCSNNQLTNLNVIGLTELQNLNCQFNQLINLNVGGLNNILNINCSYNQIASLDFSNLVNLQELILNDNAITTLNITDLINLTFFDCSNNQLASINTASLVNLVSLNCSSNLIASLAINSLTNFTDLNCSSNQLTSLSLINLSNLTDLNCSSNQLNFINLSDLINLINFNCFNNQLNALNFTGLTTVENINCYNNQIATIDLAGLNQLISLDCNSNQLENLELSNLENLKYLFCNTNSIIAMNVEGLTELQVLSFSNNQVTAINLTSTNNLQSLYCANNQISTLNLNSLSNFQNLFCANNDLTSVFIKNGSFENNLQFSGNPNLEFICADDFEINFVQDEITINNYTNCHVNSYCSFAPGGVSYVIQGNTRFDNNTNGCDPIDTLFPNLQFSFSDGVITENLIANNLGNYSKSLKTGSYTFTPILENSNYFSVSPTAISIDFPQITSPFVQNFCVTPNGNHSDIEIAFFPLNNAIPNLDAKYKIVFKNKGTITQSGSINLNFNDAILDFLTSDPASTSQSTNNLNWSFTNLNPLETRSILITLNVNASTDTIPVNIGQVLAINAAVTTVTVDEYPKDNLIQFNQIVVGSDITNNKICIQGGTVSTTQVGEYVHYCIRFKNIGTAIAQNIVLKDVIDMAKYDITTLLPIDGSHVFITKIFNLNTVEFIFENINLAFGNLNSDGYVLFKIKTLPTLAVGDNFSNTATIYFDYKIPLITNIESTSITALANQIFENSQYFRVYPNPVKDLLHLYSANLHNADSMTIYNLQGQLIQIIINPNVDLSINVSELKAGIYFLTVKSETNSSSVKFIKE